MSVIPVYAGLPPSHLDEAAEVLARAFQHDPLSCYVFPKEARRGRVLRWMFHCHLRYGLRYGQVYTCARGDGVAIWLPPGQTTQTLWRLLRTGALPAPLRFGWSAFRRSMTFLRVLTRWHEHYAPAAHWYLFYVGVTPAQQGRGLGSALLQPVLARADAEALPCYVETGVARNRGFYAQHGFQVVAEAVLPRGGPRLWAMVRAPRGA
jgi:ribosomal protein S18 acetylase RimI-like enzyme